VTQEAESGLP